MHGQREGEGAANAGAAGRPDFSPMRFYGAPAETLARLVHALKYTQNY
jgi:hypothetical protein